MSKGTSGTNGSGFVQSPEPTSTPQPSATPTAKPSPTPSPSPTNSKYIFSPKSEISAAQLFAVISSKIDLGEFTEDEVASYGRAFRQHFSKK